MSFGAFAGGIFDGLPHLEVSFIDVLCLEQDFEEEELTTVDLL